MGDWDPRIEPLHTDLVTSGSIAEERGSVFLRFMSPTAPRLGSPCGQGGDARHRSRACLGCGKIEPWEVVPFLPLSPWPPEPFCMLRTPNSIPEGPQWSREDLDFREAGPRGEDSTVKRWSLGR